MAASKRKAWRPTREQLVRALVRSRREATRAVDQAQMLRELTALRPRMLGQPARFIALTSQQRGTFGVLWALDEDGQLWQKNQLFNRESKTLVAEWWEHVPIHRGKPADIARAEEMAKGSKPAESATTVTA